MGTSKPAALCCFQPLSLSRDQGFGGTPDGAQGIARGGCAGAGNSDGEPADDCDDGVAGRGEVCIAQFQPIDVSLGGGSGAGHGALASLESLADASLYSSGDLVWTMAVPPESAL